MQACFDAPIYITIPSTLLRREVIPSEQQQLGQKSTKKNETANYKTGKFRVYYANVSAYNSKRN